MTTPLLLGHRGHRLARFGEIENTIPAFDRALLAGCDGLELDLHLTVDDRVVIHHDPELSGFRVPIAECSLRALRRLHPQLATLDQILRRYCARAWLDLEIKAAAAALPALELIRRWPPRRGYVLSCFDPAPLELLARAQPDLPLCLNLRRPARLRRLREGAAKGITWIAPQQASCTAWYVRRLRAQGWHVLVWTVNSPAKIRLLARAGADAIVSDNPHLLVETLSAKQTR